MKQLARAAALTLAAAPALADEPPRDFIDANVLAIFYHELGHAAIDTLQLPVLAQEEDAADVLAILLIDALYEPAAAEALAYDAAVGFLFEAEEVDDPAFWDVHGPEMQRYFTLVCLFYGADTEGRAGFADDLALPEERAETCEEEFDLAAQSWGAVLDDLQGTRGHPLRYLGGTGPLDALIADEVAALNQDFRWPQEVTVTVAACDEVNAFYDPGNRAITVCAELEGFYRDMFYCFE